MTRDEIFSLIEEHQYIKARDVLIRMNAVDIALTLSEAEQHQLLIMFRILPKEIAAQVFPHLSTDLQQYIIESTPEREIESILNDLFFDDAIDFIEEMPANVAKKILANTSEEKRKLINKFLNYPDDSAGSLMTIEYVDLVEEMTVAQAMQRVRDTGVDKETVDTCYVLNNTRILVGHITIRKLILSDPFDLIKDIMMTDAHAVRTNDDQEDVAALFKVYDYFVMPVVDSENRLVGIITVDDIIDVIEQENTEDFQKMAAMSPSEEAYLQTNAFTLAKHRIPWLLVLMISATFTGAIIKRYEVALQSVVILAAFIPMIMDTGGNAGSQSSTLVIRGLALDQIELKDALRVFWKEVQVGTISGLLLAIVNFLRLALFESNGFRVSITVSVTLFFTVVLAKIVGGVLPLVAKRLRLDPAIMAGPLITTIVDAVALMLYFGTATYALGI